MSGKAKRFNKVVVGATIFVVIAISVFFVFEPFQTQKANAENPIENVTVPKKTTTTSLPVPQLPQPENSPEDPYEKVPVVEIGKIEIPKIGLEQKVFNGVWLSVLSSGPGHWPGTAMPGEYGNTVIAGHRVTHTKPFRNIDQLEVGDEIIVTTQTGRHVYKVTGSQIVYPKDIWIVDQTPGFRITLFACHPPGSAKQRYVIYGDLVDPPFEVPTNV